MGFTEAISSAFSHYLNFNGRASRAAYWWWALFVILVVIVTSILDNVLGLTFTDAASGVSTGIGPITVVATLALLLPGISVAVRRLHDTDRSGWWLLISAIPIVGGLVLLYFYVISGTPGPNRFGTGPDM